MPNDWKRFSVALAAICALAVTLVPAPVRADEPGITPTEIVLGGTHPYSGPASAYGIIGKGVAAYFAYVNASGGVNGRKITYLDRDDGYSPPQAVQLVKQLVEQDHVFAIFNSLGTPSNTAIRPYLNAQKVPQIFVATGANTWGHDAGKFPWTIGWQPDYQAEAIIYARDLLKRNPNAKIGVLYQNDDYGNDYLNGLNKGLGAKKSMIVKAASYEVSEPNVTSEVASLKAAGADTFFIFATPKFSSQALVAAAQQSWKPLTYLNNVSAQQPVLKAAAAAAGPGAVEGVITTEYLKDPNDPAWNSDAGMKIYRDVMAKYAPGGDTTDANYIYGMGVAFSMVDALQRCGKTPTRDALMNAVSHLDETKNPFMIPTILVRTTPTFRFPITQEELAHYENGKFVRSGNIVDARPIIMAEDK